MNKLLFLLSCILLTGCVQTKLTSMKNPDYATTAYNRLLVIAQYDGIDMLRGFESHVAQRLIDGGVWASSRFVVMPPLKKYTDSAFNAICQREGIDGLLVIRPAGGTTVNVTNVTSNAFGTGLNATSQQEVNSVGTVVELLDLKTRETVWKAETESTIPRYEGTALAGVTGVMESMADEVYIGLRKNRLVRKTLKESD